ncbi:integration host factor, actinobacterial type [Janibacter sp. RAF20_2_2]|uniref:integration host factor, actinobacterial type n=1 Tax=unclassified Janibacter TaxID=2649294 RepID=UPI003F8FAA59
MPVPPLTSRQRAEALARAAAARRSRADLQQRLKHGSVGLEEVLRAGGDDPAVARMRVVTLVESLPGVGPATAARVMEELGIASSRRVRGLGPRQRTALLERFTRV